MPRRGNVFTQGCYYHLYNRGVNRVPIFFKPSHYEHCLRLIKRYSQDYGASIIAYCLMPNHYHLMIRQETEHPLSRFIGIVFNAYVQAVNKDQGRSGALFAGRFRHVLIDDEAYLIHLCRYIHLNPVKAGLASRPEAWPYSNYLEWIGQRSGTLQDKAFIQDRFDTPQTYREFVHGQQHDSEQLAVYMLD